VTDVEEQARLHKLLDQTIIARDRVRIEWQLNQIAARIIRAVIADRFSVPPKGCLT